jgi:hypothetical protein
VREHRQQFTALNVIEKSADFLAGERFGEPLHIIFHEHLHRGASDRPRALNSHAHPAADGHVRAEEDAFCHFDRSEAESRNLGL